ncbi:MAG TPA: hypothetical protein VFR42_10620 [Candidatus Acidoferrum sp.]|nr:hypothetical protein [Candidatus Acidoferrum sp.]
MNSKLRFASGISVLFTTLAFTHIMFHDTVHFLHGPESHWFVGIHTVVAIVLIILSFTGAYYILTSGRKPSA